MYHPALLCIKQTEFFVGDFTDKFNLSNFELIYEDYLKIAKQFFRFEISFFTL